ncbi:hypothetical protein EYF80_016657 [Liparis tanakae]|uniref:Uncharacterized protein n=1 Tax=Liparis tanakae TaxID=230148 RepID=A0A4Z2I5Y4_9TELE|nr:hypothetical protein EYF80_016657 [Liparis tanakae]
MGRSSRTAELAAEDSQSSSSASLQLLCSSFLEPIRNQYIVLRSGCRVKPTGQLQRTPVTESWHVLSQPPLFTAQRTRIPMGKHLIPSTSNLKLQRLQQPY